MTNRLSYKVANILNSAYQLLPRPMNSPEARAMILAIALQESGFVHRRQINGPARGFWQFEKEGVSGVLMHSASGKYARRVCRTLQYRPTVSTVYTAIEHNDVLALAIARLLLWTLPKRLPRSDETWYAWDQYSEAWRPGKPKKETWKDNYELAWRAERFIGARI